MMDFAQAATSWFDNLWGTPDDRPHEHGPNGLRRRKYTGEELRAIRAHNGVGRRHDGEDRHHTNVDAWVRRNWQVNAMYERWLAADIMRRGIIRDAVQT